MYFIVIFYEEKKLYFLWNIFSLFKSCKDISKKFNQKIILLKKNTLMITNEKIMNMINDFKKTN